MIATFIYTRRSCHRLSYPLFALLRDTHTRRVDAGSVDIECFRVAILLFIIFKLFKQALMNNLFKEIPTSIAFYVSIVISLRGSFVYFYVYTKLKVPFLSGPRDNSEPPRTLCNAQGWKEGPTSRVEKPRRCGGGHRLVTKYFN